MAKSTCWQFRIFCTVVSHNSYCFRCQQDHANLDIILKYLNNKITRLLQCSTVLQIGEQNNVTGTLTACCCDSHKPLLQKYLEHSEYILSTEMLQLNDQQTACQVNSLRQKQIINCHVHLIHLYSEFTNSTLVSLNSLKLWQWNKQEHLFKTELWFTDKQITPISKSLSKINTSSDFLTHPEMVWYKFVNTLRTGV